MNKKLNTKYLSWLEVKVVVVKMNQIDGLKMIWKWIEKFESCAYMKNRSNLL